ncbi:plasmid replication initiator TrfA [Bordetella genomosp. 5]|uniref:plasmid replication initiator TrfA n=1 Tax=Bordetella genomosp. 5 TaxID=1395608 RepID=UPI00159603A8|nr:plasmid replication initiator TrfA [Bordetella genomosp. 5]
MASAEEFEVWQLSGWQLDQADAELWHQIVRVAVLEGQGVVTSYATVNVSLAQLMSATTRKKGGKTRTLLSSSLQRLMAATFEIRCRHRTVLFQPLVTVISAAAKSGRLEVTLGAGLPELVQERQFVVLRRAERTPLLQEPLACGLHAYFASHVTPYPIKSQTLKRLLGRDSMQDSKWRLALVAALGRLREVTGWPACSLGVDDKVTVVRARGKVLKAPSPRLPAPERIPPASLDDASMELERIRMTIDI